MPELVLGHTEVFVKEPMKSKDFYTRVLGFKLVGTQEDKYVWLISGDKEILLRPAKSDSVKADKYDKTDIAFVMYTSDLALCRELLESKGVEFKDFDGTENCLTFTDPDGNWIQLVDPGEH